MRKMIATLGIVTFLLLGVSALAQQEKAARTPATSSAKAKQLRQRFNCDQNDGGLCADLWNHKTFEGYYSGHDEPALAFYSEVPGSGDSLTARLKLPLDPPTLPSQDGTGGTFNFQLHAAFWFSMALCDTQSAPEFTQTCTPASDSNIFDNPDPTAPDFITLHPGGAFMELQFYPPGWVFLPTDPLGTRWVAALTITSDAFSQVTGQDNNADCLDTIGEETQNFAYITKKGAPQFPPDPMSIAQNPFGALLPDVNQAFFMNPGDEIIVFVHDTGQGLRVILFDSTTKTFGWMTASAANGFKQVLFQPDPDPSNPTVPCTEQPYTFRAMYSTSSEHTRLTWTAHAFNIGFSDEIGHFEYCNAVDANGNCTSVGVNEPDGMLDFDDIFCASTLPPPSPAPFIPVAGCVAEDLDFDGVSYGLNWPGTLSDPVMDSQLHPAPIIFSSPRFSGPRGLIDFDRVAFESNAPILPDNCDPVTGDGCVNPPPGAAFYPLYSTTTWNGGCAWQFGGGNIPGTTNAFGGSAATEFSTITAFNYPFGGQAFPLFETFRQILDTNPCPAAH
jgi:hypothetical protein